MSEGRRRIPAMRLNGLPPEDPLARKSFKQYRLTLWVAVEA